MRHSHSLTLARGGLLAGALAAAVATGCASTAGTGTAASTAADTAAGRPPVAVQPAGAAGAAKPAGAPAGQPRPFADVVKEAQRTDGFFVTWQKDALSNNRGPRRGATRVDAGEVPDETTDDEGGRGLGPLEVH